MGFDLGQAISDGWNAVTAPIKSVAQSIQDTIHDPGNAANLISLGIAPVVAISKYGVEHADQAKNFAIGAATTVQTGGLNLVGQNAWSQKQLRDPTISKLSFGASQDFAGASNASGDWLDGRRGSKADEEGALRFGVKYAAAAATVGGISAYTAAGHTIGTTGYLLGYKGGQDLASGNIKGAADAALGGAGLSGLDPFVNQLLPGAPVAGPSYNLGGVKYQLPSYDTSQLGNYPPISTGTGFSGPSQGVSPAVYVVAGLALLFIAKKKGLI